MPETIPVILARRGWKPSDLAYEARLSYSVISNAINGQKISEKTARKICKALKMDLKDIDGLNY